MSTQSTLRCQDAWTLGSYRRLDQLDVPAFHQPPHVVANLNPPRRVRQAVVFELSTDWPRVELALDAHLAGQCVQAGEGAPAPDVLERLGLLLRHLASPLRFEPLNTYGVHRAVPSPRCQYPHTLFLLLAQAGGVRQFRYVSEHHALEDLGLTPAWAPALGGADVALMGVAQFGLLADKYGEFTPYPVMLEAGMAQAQLLHLAAAVGWPGEAAPEASLAAVGPLAPHEVVAYGWRGQAPGLAAALDALPRRGLRISDRQAAIDLAQRFPRLAALSSMLAPRADRPAALRPPMAEAAATAPVGPVAPGASPDLLRLMRQRQSGNDAHGMAPRLDPLPPGSLALLLQRWQGLVQRRPALPGETALMPRCLWLEGAERGLYRPDAPAQPLAEARAWTVLQDALPLPGMRWNLSPFKAGLFLCVDVARAAGAHGDASLRRLHLAAGAAAQDFCLAATSLGLFARPMRMLNERVLEQGLPLPGLPVYQVLCGLNRSTNLSWELL